MIRKYFFRYLVNTPTPANSPMFMSSQELVNRVILTDDNQETTSSDDLTDAERKSSTDTEEQDFVSQYFPLNTENITVRRNRPVRKSPRSNNNNYDHLINSKNITLRRKYRK